MFRELLCVFVMISMSVVMPIVLATALNIYLNLTNRVFHEYLEILLWYDILVYSETKEKHEYHLCILC